MPELVLPLCLTLVGALIERTLRIAGYYDPVLTSRELIFSQSHKTGHCISLPVAFTCITTVVCARVCYAAVLSRAPRWIKCLRKQIRVYRYLLATSPEEIAERIHRDFLRLPRRWGRRQTFIRVCGVGDLVLELVLAINIFVNKYPHIPVWVVTRNRHLVGVLDRDAENLFIQFSLDASEDSRQRMEQVLALHHPRIYFSFLRTKPTDEIPDVASVVYNQQDNRMLPADDHPGLCPADVRRIPMAGACELCRRCFSPTCIQRGSRP